MAHQRSIIPHLIRTALLSLFGCVLFSLPAEAHVKWFSKFSYADRPLTFAEAITPAFLALGLLSIIAIGALVPLDHRLRNVPFYRRIDDWLASHSDRSVLVMRIAAGAVLLLSWQAGAMLVPELKVSAAWLGWYVDSSVAGHIAGGGPAAR